MGRNINVRKNLNNIVHTKQPAITLQIVILTKTMAALSLMEEMFLAIQPLNYALTVSFIRISCGLDGSLFANTHHASKYDL